MFYENGNLKFDGKWKEDEYYDFGKLYSEFGKLKSKGFYGKRSFTFEGAKYWGDGETRKAEGLFIDGKLELKGKKYYDNGRVMYKGEMKGGKYSGYGSLFH